MDHLGKRSLPANEGLCTRNMLARQIRATIYTCMSCTIMFPWPLKFNNPYVFSTKIPAVSCLARRDLRTYLPMFCDCSALWVLVMFDIIRCVRTQDLRVPSEEAIHFLSIFQTLAVSCLVRRDFRTHLPMFHENSRLSELVYWAHYVWEFMTCSWYL